MLNSRLLAASLILSCIGSLFGCASQQPPVELSAQQHKYYSRTELLDGSVLNISPQQQLPEVNLLIVNDEMRAFLDQHVPARANDQQKVQAILKAILDDGLQLQYDSFQTLTADEVFYTREGNCMSFTSLFVALAREAGLSARFQEIEVPPTWESRGTTWLFNKHLNAVVDLPGGSIVVDFSLENFDTDYRRRVLRDRSTLARYHNNMGVHNMSEGEYELSLLHFRKALELAPNTGYFWANLGSLYKRSEHPKAAEAAYLEAIDVSGEPVAMSNLARLYQGMGQPELARWYEEKVELFRSQNPYYVFHMAEQAYDAGEYELTVSKSKAAIKHYSGHHEMYRLLGLAYVHLGELDKAKSAFSDAAELAEDEDIRTVYAQKMRLLANH